LKELVRDFSFQPFPTSVHVIKMNQFFLLKITGDASTGTILNRMIPVQEKRIFKRCYSLDIDLINLEEKIEEAKRSRIVPRCEVVKDTIMIG
jgi:hypothetical protein